MRDDGSWAQRARGWAVWAWSLGLLVAACDDSSAKDPDQPTPSAAAQAPPIGGMSGAGAGRNPAGPGAGGDTSTGGSVGGVGSGGAGSGGASMADAASPANDDGSVPGAADGGSDASEPSMQVQTPYVYISGYGSSIHVFTLDMDSGALTSAGNTNGGTSPSYLAVAPDRRTLYAINEASGANSQVIAYAIDAATGKLQEINREQTGGDGAPHLALHPSGKWVAVAHYGSGHTTILPVRADGGVLAPIDSKRGPSDGCQQAHQAVFDASGEHLFVPCLGSNYVIQYTFADGTLGYNDPATVAVSGGPRHMAFDPSETHAYVLSELSSTITSFLYDATSGKLTSPESIDSYQNNPGSSAHIVVHPAGKVLYASNRAENSIGVFSIDAGGRPHAVDFVTDMIATPRDFAVEASGKWLISANQSGAENALVFRIDPDDGTLEHAKTIPVGDQPTFAGVVLLP